MTWNRTCLKHLTMTEGLMVLALADINPAVLSKFLQKENKWAKGNSHLLSFRIQILPIEVSPKNQMVIELHTLHLRWVWAQEKDRYPESLHKLSNHLAMVPSCIVKQEDIFLPPINVFIIQVINKLFKKYHCRSLRTIALQLGHPSPAIARDGCKYSNARVRSFWLYGLVWAFGLPKSCCVIQRCCCYFVHADKDLTLMLELNVFDRTNVPLHP